MALKNCEKSKYHGLYDTTKNITCPWCDTSVVNTVSNVSKKRLEDMSEEELMLEKFKFALPKIFSALSLAQKHRDMKQYEESFRFLFGTSLSDEFEKDYNNK